MPLFKGFFYPTRTTCFAFKLGMNTMFDNTAVAFQSKSKKSLLKAYWLFRFMGWNKLTKIGTYFVKIALKTPLGLKKIIKNTLYRQFCGGETLVECQETIAELSKFGLLTIPDYVAEGQDDEESFNAACDQILATIAMAKENKAIAFAVFKVTAIGSFEVLEKKQRGDVFSAQETMAWFALKARFNKLIQAASESNIRILIDAEETWIQDVVDELTLDAMMRYNDTKALVFITCQMYRKDMLHRLKSLADRAREQHFNLGVKLVRGAYLERENARAMALGLVSPMHPCKEDTDQAFDSALHFCLEQGIHVCIGTHNEESVLKAIAFMKTLHINASTEHVCFAQLYGMSDHISFNLAAQGYCVAKYLPFGPMELSLPYLFRRANENKSIAGQVSRELLLIKNELQRRAKQS